MNEIWGLGSNNVSVLIAKFDCLIMGYIRKQPCLEEIDAQA